jgi:RNA polymerase sigma-32 factor
MSKPLPNWGTQSRRKRSPDMLSADDELHLVRAWQQRGDGRARDRLIGAFRPMARAMAKRFSIGLQAAEPDLVQQANIGLLKAADRFDPDRGYRFSTYAVCWVRAEIQDYKLANISIVRRPNSTDFRKAVSQLAQLDATALNHPSISRADADKKVAAALGVSVRRLNDLRQQISGADISLNAPAFGDEGGERVARLIDPASAEHVGSMHGLDIKTLRDFFILAMRDLPDRERQIIMATQLENPPATLGRLGTQLGISAERVRQLRERGVERLRTAMGQRDLPFECFV